MLKKKHARHTSLRIMVKSFSYFITRLRMSLNGYGAIIMTTINIHAMSAAGNIPDESDLQTLTR
ncbi:hypothetical protein [Dissulfurispira sp.]|uniref:hypothetical protein n=1 Tax=Dissulfurispira sp. TaxID=2817609 RepID=UPI002FDAB4D2